MHYIVYIQHSNVHEVCFRQNSLEKICTEYRRMYCIKENLIYIFKGRSLVLELYYY